MFSYQHFFLSLKEQGSVQVRHVSGSDPLTDQRGSSESADYKDYFNFEYRTGRPECFADPQFPSLSTML